MSLITDTWRQLVQRRLWPIALLLVAALVAVPVLLAKDPAPVAPSPAGAAPAADDQASTEPVVALAEGGDAGRHVLGARKDPFRPSATPTPTGAAAAAATSSGSTSHTSTTTATVSHAQAPTSSSSGSATSPSSTTTGGSSTGSSGSGPAITTPGGSSPSGGTAKPSPKPAPPLYSIKVRFGDGTSDGTVARYDRLEPLPDTDAPVVIYLGPGREKRSAEFLVDASVTPEGDGTCKPYPQDCQKVVLREGETEFFDVKTTAADGSPSASGDSTTYELDLLSIQLRKGASASRARSARAAFRALRPAQRRAVRRAVRAHASGAHVAHVVKVLKPSL